MSNNCASITSNLPIQSQINIEDQKKAIFYKVYADTSNKVSIVSALLATLCIIAESNGPALTCYLAGIGFGLVGKHFEQLSQAYDKISQLPSVSNKNIVSLS